MRRAMKTTTLTETKSNSCSRATRHGSLSSIAPFALLSALSTLASCAGGGGVTVNGKPFSPDSLNDDNLPRAQAAVLDRLSKNPPAATTDALIAVTGTAEITGIDLKSGKTWTYTHPLDRRPRIAGPLVVGSGGGEVFALDVSTGQEKWKTTKLAGKLIGAGSDGSHTAITMKVDDGSRFVVLDATGSIRVDKSTSEALARPGIAGGMAFVPWKALYVTAFDADNGDQLATFITDTETTHVRTIGTALFAGQGRLVRFDSEIMKAKQGGAHIAIPPVDLPDVSRRDLLVSPDHDEKLPADAIDQTVLAGRPTPSGDAAFAADRIYGGYYKLIMGWGSKDAKLAWVHTGKDDIVAASATSDGVITVDEGGTVKFLAAENGTLTKTLNVGKAVLDADIWTDSITVGAAAGGKSVTDQIKEAVMLNSNDLATAQLYLVRQLAAVADEDATKVLLEVADSDRTAGALKDEARKAIALRTNGADAMIALLGRHASFMTDTHSPPVGPMAIALSAMKATKASQPLLDQLLDPALPQKDLLDTATGVGALATADQLPQLQKFINLYRGSATGNIALTDSVGAIGAAILRVGGDKGKEWVVNTAKDPLTDVDVRAALQKVLDAAAPKKVDAPPVDDGTKKDDKKKPPVDDGPVPGGLKKKKPTTGAPAASGSTATSEASAPPAASASSKPPPAASASTTTSKPPPAGSASSKP